MAINVGDRLPDATFMVTTDEGPAPVTTAEFFGGRKVVLFAVPGAFTPTCDKNHLPGYIAHADAIRARGVDAIAVTGVNDVFVMNAWAKSSGGKGIVEFLSDGSAVFARAIGMDNDMSARGFGTRSKRYSMIVDDGVVKHLAVEESPGQADLSGAQKLLEAL